MNATEQAMLERHFIEEVGLLFETAGVQRMAGRVMGHLLICEPKHQSSAELAEALNASRGAISQSTRSLVQMGLIEKVPVPGDRATYFAWVEGSFANHLHAEAARTRLFRELVARGMDLLRDAGRAESSVARLQELHDMFVFFEQEWPALIERWEASRRSK